MDPINLAMKSGGPVSMPERDEAYYPSLHIESDEKIDFPHEGTMTIRFKKTSSSMSERNGEAHYSCTIEAREILDMEADEETDTRSESKKTEAALDRHMAEMEKKNNKAKGY
jgi:hypothetical protein